MSVEGIPDEARRFKDDTRLDPNAKMRTEEFWQEHRADTRSFGEKRMGAFLEKLQKVKGFKPVLFVAKAFIENSSRRLAKGERINNWNYPDASIGISAMASLISLSSVKVSPTPIP